ncbi:MAG: nickel pincer cofactor biosynthesis protein LarB, partial [Candidatus Rokuibacteriota bacterium]
MDAERLRALLQAVQEGRLGADEALQRLRRLPFEDLGFAKLDTHRAIRSGMPEAVFCQGKTPEQIVRILERLGTDHANVLATRADAAVHDAARAAGLRVRYHADARLLVVNPIPVDGVGLVVVATGGTADLPIAEEAAITAEALGNRVERVYDAGVAGLHRLLQHHPLLLEANALVVVAGMEGALPSVVGG